MRGRTWAYAGALMGGGVSVAANVAHSFVPPGALPPAMAEQWRPEPGAVALSMFWPIFLFVAVEILTRVPWPDDLRYVTLRFAGLLPVAAVAAFVSYRHLSGLMLFYGEDRFTAAVGPLAVDGLMVMATGALMATSRAVTPGVTGDIPAVRECTDDAPRVTVSVTRDDATITPVMPAITEGVTGVTPTHQEDITPVMPDVTPESNDVTRDIAGDDDPVTAVVTPAMSTREKVIVLRGAYPSWSQAEIGRRLGVTAQTVSRHLSAVTADDAQPVTAMTGADPS